MKPTDRGAPARSSMPVRSSETPTGRASAMTYQRSGTRHVVILVHSCRSASRPLSAAVTTAATAGPSNATSATYTDAPVYGRSAHVNPHARMKKVVRRERSVALSVLPPTVGDEFRHFAITSGESTQTYDGTRDVQIRYRVTSAPEASARVACPTVVRTTLRQEPLVRASHQPRRFVLATLSGQRFAQRTLRFRHCPVAVA